MDRGLREQLRPTTAPMRRPDTMNYQSERSKYWRNTKKFDTGKESNI